MRIHVSYIFTLLILFVNMGLSAAVTVRHYDTRDGLTHTHVRDMVQDDNGYMWFATWCGVDRFDGYEFRNFRSHPDDSIKLDNNRVERVAVAPTGDIVIATYSGRVYRLDRVSGSFRLGSEEDSLIFENRNKSVRGKPLPELEKYINRHAVSYIDSRGNIWLGHNDGIDFISVSPRAFKFIDCTAIDSIGKEIHALYVSPDDRIWVGARDTRVMLYDSAGVHIGNLLSDGRIVTDSLAGFGMKPYAFLADMHGRVWIGTKSHKLVRMTPASPRHYNLDIYGEGKTHGALRCGDIYDLAFDRNDNLWLATFGAGVAKVNEDSLTGVSFTFPHNYPTDKAPKIRRLVCSPSGRMTAATTSGIVTFDTDAQTPEDIRFCFYHTEPSRNGSLSNDDILDIYVANDGALYFSAFSGGIDYVTDESVLSDSTASFSNLNIRDGLHHDPILSIIQDADSCFWVVALNALSRYTPDWKFMSTYNEDNLGREIRFTEAKPQRMSDGRLVFGLRGGILIVDPSEIDAPTPPALVVTEVIAGGNSPLPVDYSERIQLPVGCRDIAIHFAAIDFDGAANIMYAYRTGDSDRWIELGHERTLHLSSLPAGDTQIWIRSTDSFGRWSDNEIGMSIRVPYTWTEILLGCLALFGILVALAAIGYGIRIFYLSRNRRRRLNYYLDMAISGNAADSGDTMARVCHVIGNKYHVSTLKAENIANELNLGRNTLRNEVKSSIGISIEDFIRMIRIAAASRLLRDSTLTVAEIAYNCGFKTPQYMAMLFKEQMGCTPKEYASRYKKDVSN